MTRTITITPLRFFAFLASIFAAGVIMGATEYRPLVPLVQMIVRFCGAA